MLKENYTKRYHDLVWLTLALCLLCLEIGVLAYQMRWLGEFSLQPVNHLSAGRVLEKKSQLTHRSRGSLSWFPLQPGDSIPMNDTVLTGPRSRAVLELDGEGTIELGPETLLRISEPSPFALHDSVSFEVPQGQVKVRAGKKVVQVRVRNKPLNILPEAEVVLEPKPFVEEVKVEVTKGKVEIIPEPTIEVPAPEIVMLKEGEKITMTEAAVPPPDVPVPKLPEVAYVLRGPASEKPVLGEHITLRWEEVAKAEGYRVEVSLDEAFTSVFYDHEVVGREVTLEEVPPGTLFWRVRARLKDIGELPPSPVSQFSVKKRLEPPKTKKVKVLKDEGALVILKSSLLAGKGVPKTFAKKGATLVFEWEAIRGAVQYRLQIAEDQEFKQGLIQKDVESIEFKLTVPYRSHYFWRVAAIDLDGDVHSFSEPEKILAEKPKPRVPPPPPKPVVIQPPVEEPKREVAAVVTAPTPVIEKVKLRAWDVNFFAGGMMAFESFSQTGSDYQLSARGNFPTMLVGLQGEVRGSGEWAISAERPFVVYSQGANRYPVSLFSLGVDYHFYTGLDQVRILLGGGVSKVVAMGRDGNTSLTVVTPTHIPLHLGVSVAHLRWIGIELVGQAYMSAAPMGDVRSVGGGGNLTFRFAGLSKWSAPSVFVDFQWNRRTVTASSVEYDVTTLTAGTILSLGF